MLENFTSRITLAIQLRGGEVVISPGSYPGEHRFESGSRYKY